MERSGRIRDTFWCGIIVLQDLQTFEGRWLIQPLAWMLCPLKAAILAHQIVKVLLQAAPPPSPAGSYALLSPCLVSSSILLSVVDLWIFPPSFLVSRSNGWEGRVLKKTILVPSPPPPIATLKEAAGLARILRRILPFHCFMALFLFLSEL